jgi:hypothetical protein
MNIFQPVDNKVGTCLFERLSASVAPCYAACLCPSIGSHQDVNRHISDNKRLAGIKVHRSEGL